MLAIRMQRTGRTRQAMFRMVVQESHLHPKSGRVVARLGHYDPHTKSLSLDKEKVQTYLSNGAHPSDRAVLLLRQEGVKLPAWVEMPKKRTGSTRNPEKLRKNRPAEPANEAAAEKPETEATPVPDAAQPSDNKPEEAVAEAEQAKK